VSAERSRIALLATFTGVVSLVAMIACPNLARAQAGRASRFRCDRLTHEYRVVMELDAGPSSPAELNGASTSFVCAIHGSEARPTTPEDCAAALGRCAIEWGGASATIDAADHAVVHFVPGVALNGAYRDVPGTSEDEAPPADVPPGSPGPPPPYRGFAWEAGLVGAVVVEQHAHSLGGAGGMTGRLGGTVDPRVVLTVSGLMLIGGAAWATTPTLGLGGTADVELFALRGDPSQADLGAMDLAFIFSMGALTPFIGDCGPIGAHDPACHHNIAWRAGMRLIPTGGASSHDVSAFGFGFDVWWGYAPDIGEWIVAPMMQLGFSGY
jgi:hypothetical protein